jgi:hypothetical protein
MDEDSWNGTSGEVIDSSGNNNHGTGNGGVTTGAGKFGKGGDFDGSDDYVEIADSAELRPGDNSWTVAVWAKPENASQNRPIIAKRQNAGTFDQFNLIVCGNLQCGSSGRRLSVLYRGDNNYRYSLSDIDVADGNWHHFVMVADKSADIVRLYMDGVELSITTSSSGPWPVLNNTDPLQIGGENGSKFFNGQIDETRIYNRALTPAEVQSLYRWAPGPVGYWKLDEGSGTQTLDSSGNGNKGNFYGTPAWVAGKYGSALKFSGSSQSIELEHNPVINPNIITYSAWYKVHSMPANNTRSIISKTYDGNDRSYHLDIMSNASGDTYTSNCMISTDGSTQYFTPSPYTIELDKWYFQTCTYDGETLRMYINGSFHSQDTSPSGNIYESDSDLYIGGTFGNNRGISINATIDDVKIYNYARTPEQIIQDMNAGHPAPGSPISSPLVYFNFEEGHGGTANNLGYGGNAYNADLGGSSNCPGSSTCPTWTLNGKLGKGLSFDGDTSPNGDYATVNLPGLIGTGTDSFTISSWLKLNSTPNENELVIAKRGWNGGISTVSGINAYRCRIANTTPESFYIEYTTTLGQWEHYICQYDATTNKLKLYVNGQFYGETQITGTIYNYSDTLYIGGYDGGWAANVDIDEVKIYNFALSPYQVKIEHNQGMATVFGSKSTDSSGGAAFDSARGYCVPGDTTTCNTPVVHLKMDEQTGQYAYDSSGNGKTATLVNSPAWQHAGNCVSGSCIKFNGEDQNATLTDNYNTGTYSLWLKILNHKTWNVVFDGGANDNIIISTGGGGTLHARQGGGTGLSTNSTLDVNKWYHIAAVTNGSAITNLYINGIAQSGTTPGMYAGTGLSAIGSLSSGSERHYLDGLIDDFRIYNYTRTPAQIAWDYNRGAPVGHWKFNECLGTAAHDASGNGNHGTIIPGSSGQTSVGNCSTNANTMWYNGRNGKFNGSLNFDGTDDYVDIGDPTELQFGDQDLTITTWVKYNNDSNYPRIISKWNSTTDNRSWNLFYNTFTNRFEWQVSNDGINSSTIACNASNTTTSGTWYFLSAMASMSV